MGSQNRASTAGPLSPLKLVTNWPATVSIIPVLAITFPGTRKVDIARSIYRDPRGPRDSCIDGWSSVAAIRRCACSGDRGDDPGRYLDSPHAIVITIGNVDVPGCIQRDTNGSAKHRAGCLTPIAAMTQDSSTSDCGDGAASCPDLADDATPVADVHIVL